MRRIPEVAILAFALALVSCAGTAVSSGTPEAALYAARCGSCHALPHPKRHYSKDWAHIVALMDEHMQQRNFGKLSPRERSIILKYLQENAR